MHCAHRELLELYRPSAAIPLPQGIPPVVTLVVLLRLTGVAAGLVRGGSSGLAETRGSNEDNQSQSGDERLHSPSPSIAQQRRRVRRCWQSIRRLRRLDRGQATFIPGCSHRMADRLKPVSPTLHDMNPATRCASEAKCSTHRPDHSTASGSSFSRAPAVAEINCMTCSTLSCTP